MSEESARSPRGSYRTMIRRLNEEIDPPAPARHLVKDGRPTCPEGASLLKRKALSQNPALTPRS